MFGKNPITRQNLGDGQSLHLVKGSPFLTIQGEGPYAGQPAVFIRLHGCNLACTFCDTQFSDPNDPVLSLQEINDKIDAVRGNTRLVVITGGEPLLQQIVPLCKDLLWHHGLTVQIETAGTVWIDGLNKVAEIVVSPKTARVDPMILCYAKAFKYVIDCEQNLDGFIPVTATQANARPVRLAMPRDNDETLVWLSPMDTYDAERNARNRKLVGQLALKYGVNAGLQMHKFMDLD